MLITDQVATAPCTDCVQARRLTFVGKAARQSDSRMLISHHLPFIESIRVV